MAKKEARPVLNMMCPECRNKNYSTTKNKKNTTEKLELKKFCNTCRKATNHKEVK
jgi:large subunit ribosomal protein L33